MSSYFIIRRFFELILLPPASLIIGLLLGLALNKAYPQFSKFLLWSCGLCLYLTLTPLVGNLLLLSLNRYPSINLALDSEAAQQAQAIVVLTGGIYYDPQVETWMLGFHSWQRMKYAATLHRKTGLPLLLSGGKTKGYESQSEAEVMQRDLQHQQVSVQWVETQARNTAESARYAADVLLPQGCHQIILVTHSFHMLRGINQFQQAGFEVVPAPFGVRTTWGIQWLDFLPSAYGHIRTSMALHEYLGRWWYQWRQR